MFEVNDEKSYKRFLMWAYISRALSMQVFFYLHYRLKLVKLHCQGFDNTLYLIFNCLNNKKYRVKPKLILNLFKKVISGVPQSSLPDVFIESLATLIIFSSNLLNASHKFDSLSECPYLQPVEGYSVF